MNIQAILDRQAHNLWCAYDNHDCPAKPSTSIVNKIVAQGLDSKSSIIEKLGNHTLVFKKPYEEDKYRTFYNLSSLIGDFPAYSFDFSHKQVTERETGNCTSLSKFLKKVNYSTEQVELIESDCSRSEICVISAHPYFILGSSVATDGINVESSCHHPCSSTDEYKSGPISYTLDKHTIVFGIWDDSANEEGLIGRTLVYVDLEAPGIVQGRKYGCQSDSVNTFLRKELYSKLFPEYSYKLWKSTRTYSIHRNDYQGYLDKDYFTGYRPTQESDISIELVAPVCLTCGDRHTMDQFACAYCQESDRYHCEQCGCSIDDDDVRYSPDGYPYCHRHWFDRFFTCDQCGETHDNDEEIRYNGYSYCHSCAERRELVSCEQCGAYHYIGNMYTTVDNEYICNDCSSDYTLCAKCNRYELSKYINTTSDGTPYCTDCFDDLEVCDHCGNSCEATWKTTDETYVCIDCVNSTYSHVCPGCGLAHTTESVCSEECATNNLFLLAA